MQGISLGGDMKGCREVEFHEFRESFEVYLQSGDTIAVMQNGQQVGTFIPLKPPPVEATGSVLSKAAISEEVVARLAAFDKSAARLDTILEEHGITEDEVIEEFERLRRESRQANHR
jgi:hypothetical protein